MSVQYFASATTVEAIKALYRKLAFQYHPDLGGDLATMQLINSQYEAALRGVDGSESVGSDGKTHTYRHCPETERAIMEMIDKLISLNMQGVEVSLIGTWLWITGDTKPFKDALGGLGCRWHSKRGAWYFQTGKRRYRASGASLTELGRKYGVMGIDLDSPRKRVKAG